MSFVIKQEPEELRASLDLHSRAELHSIVLVSAAVERGIELRGQDELDVKVGYLLHAVDLESDSLSVTIGFDCTAGGNLGAKNAPASAFVRPVFKAGYSLQHDFQPTESQQQAFAAGNAVMNCWPYAREFLQNTFARMGLDLGPLPFLRLVAAADDPESMVAAPRTGNIKSAKKISKKAQGRTSAKAPDVPAARE